MQFVPRISEVVRSLLAAEASGKGTDLNPARLREVFKASMQLVKSTRSVVTKNARPKTWELWQADKLAVVLADLAKSDKSAKAGSLNANSKQLLDLILEGSGRAKVKDIPQGLPPVQERAVNGKRKHVAENGSVPAKKVKSQKRKANAVQQAAENETSSDSS